MIFTESVSKKDEIKALEFKKVGNMKKASQTTAALFSKQLIFSNIQKFSLLKKNFLKFLLKGLRKFTKLIISSVT